MQEDLYLVSLRTSASGRRVNDVLLVKVTQLGNFENKRSCTYHYYSNGTLKSSCGYLNNTARKATPEEILASPFRQQYLDSKKEKVNEKLKTMQPVELERKIVKVIKYKGRDVTIVVGKTPYGNMRAGYSVCSPEDKHNKELGVKIAVGRALNDRTNLTPDMEVHPSMDLKYIYYAIAESIERRIKKGEIIKGIK